MNGVKAKPRVVSIGYPKWAGQDYMKAFEAEFELHVSSKSEDATLVLADWPVDRA